MVNTRLKQPSSSNHDEPMPNRKRLTSNANNVQNKQLKINNEEPDNERSKKNEKGMKKKGKQPW